MIIILASSCILIGFLGSFLPFLPGPPLSWLGLLLLHFSSKAAFSISFLISTALITALLAGLSYYIPIWGAKRLGGTTWGEGGSAIGLILGFFFGLPGIIFGPLIGAFAGELLHDPNDRAKAMRSASGAFLGFLAGTALSMGLSLYFAYCFISVFF